MTTPHFPFTAISAQDDFKLALLLCMVDPTLGGVLALGDKGTGKTTTVRALQNLMKLAEPDFAFVNLPIGATEDRVLGSLKLETLVKEKKAEVHKGLLANANKGILYIDEINLLNDYLMDVLLDAAASGGYFLERDSISQWLESRFCLIGTMNPEEGELRPQLLDRFGLSVPVKTPTDKATRMEITNRRLDFDTDPHAFSAQYLAQELELSSKIQQAKRRLMSVTIPAHVREEIAERCIAAGVEGLRADILLTKAARAYAAFVGEHEVTAEAVYRVKDFVLAHRSKNETPPTGKQESPPPRQNEGDSSANENSGQETSENKTGLNDYLVNAGKTQQYLQPDPGAEAVRKGLKTKALAHATGARQKDNANSQAPVDLLETLKHSLLRDTLQLKYKAALSRAEAMLVFIIDSSSSMLQNQQMALVKGIVERTAARYKHQTVSYAAIALANGSARIITPFTKSTAELLASVHALRSGGKTNMKAGFRLLHQLLKPGAAKKNACQLFILTDGQINAGESDAPFQESVAYHKTVLRSLFRTTVVDVEQGFVKLGLAKQFARQIHSHYQVSHG